MTEEKECRVCRDVGDAAHPLYAPCLCNGSILYCHQDCLEEWLKRSGKRKCELCGVVYKFSPKYSPNMPNIIPLSDLIRGGIKTIYKKVLPFCFRICFSIFCWLGIVPFTSSVIYRLFMAPDDGMLYGSFWSYLANLKNFEMVFDNIASGILLTGLIGLTFIVLISFGDFLRSYWTLRENREEEEEVPGAAGVGRPIVPDENALLFPDHGPIDVNMEVRDGLRMGGMLHLRGNLHEFEHEMGEVREQLLNGQNGENRENGVVVNNVVDEDRVGDADEVHDIQDGVNRDVEVEDEDEDHELEQFQHQHLHEPEPAIPELINNEDDIDDMFELAQAVINRARENDQLIRDPPILPHHPPLPPPPLPENLNRNAPPPPPVPPGINNGRLLEERQRLPRGVENVDVELHINFEIIGLRGPIFGVLTYCCWMIAFNVCCTIIGIVTPVLLKDVHFYLIGQYWNFIFPYISSWVDPVIFQSFDQNITILLSHLEFLRPLLKPTTSDQIFRLIDLFDITIGYFFLAFFFCFTNLTLHIMKPFLQRTRVGIIQFLITNIPRVVDVIKVGTLMTIRIFWLPCVIGGIAIGCFNMLLQYPLKQLIIFGGDHIIGTIAICWGIGIAYMLSTTISILQLREILHPDWLSKFIRPQESQVDLLTSLLNEPPLVQLRRLFVSFLVYGFLLLMLVFLPIYLLRYGIGFNTPIKLYFWYFSPDMQIFFEIVFLHTYFLMILEKRKDIIGQWEHRGLLYLSQKLGISRYILPYGMKIITNSYEKNRSLEKGREVITLEDGREAVVNQPLLRPPAGWDARTRKSATRWVWGTDPLTDLQKTVAPKHCDAPYCWLRCLILIIISWCSVLVVGFSLVLIPLATGRIVLYLCHIPTSYYHDPLCMVFGYLMLQIVYQIGIILLAVSLRTQQLWRYFNFSSIKEALSILFVWGGCIPFSFGLFYHMFLNYPFNDAPNYLLTLTPMVLLRIYLFGTLVVGWISTLILTGRVDSMLLSAGYLPVFENLVFAIITVWNSLHTPSGSNMTERKLQNDLTTLKVLIIRPFIRDICYSLILTLFLLTCQYLVSQFQSSPTFIKTWSLGHLFVYITTAFLITTTFSSPIQQWAKWYYSTIKDENYLIGMELQNSVEGLKHMQSELDAEIMNKSPSNEPNEGVNINPENENENENYEPIHERDI